MTNVIGRYLLSVSAVAMLLSVVQTLLPKGAVNRICTFVGGLLIVIVVLSPVVDIDFDGLARSFMRIPNETLQTEVQTFQPENDLLADIIKQNCEEYIWDKANELGADLEVDITLSEDEDNPCPVSVVLTGRASLQQRTALMDCIRADMGIPSQRQEWRLR